MNFEIMRAIDGGEAEKAVKAGICPTCREKVGGFRDELSMKEFGISGMCQQCQDKVFNPDGYEDDNGIWDEGNEEVWNE